MNLMKQKLDSALSQLEMGPAQKTAILAKAAEPPRRTSGRRTAILALALACLLGVGAVAATSVRWNLSRQGRTVRASLQEPVTKELSPRQWERLDLYFKDHGTRGQFNSFDELESALGLSLLQSDLFVFQEYQGKDPHTPAHISYYAEPRADDGQGVAKYDVGFHLACTYALPYVDQTYLSTPSYDAVVLYQVWSNVSAAEWTSPGYKLFTTYSTGSITADIAFAADHMEANAFFTVGGFSYSIYTNVPYIYADQDVAYAENVLYAILDSLQ